jgi:hypothetical protein
MQTLRQPWLLLCLTILLAAAPRNAKATDYCVAVDGGFGSGGATFVRKGFTSPAKGTCKPWAGIMKTGTTVVGTSTGAACLSNDGKLLTITLHTTDPGFFDINDPTKDHIELCPLGACPPGRGQLDNSTYFGGPVGAAQVTCTKALTSIPSTHD